MTRSPGLGTAVATAVKSIFQRDAIYRPDGVIIDGAYSRDPSNSSDVRTLLAGLLMGKITASSKYAPAIIGVTIGAYTSGGTSLTVSAAQAVELVRRVGSSGTAALYVVGPPGAAGTVAITACTHSAINVTTGVLTVTSLGVNKIAGSFVCAADGTHLPRTFLPDGDGVHVVDDRTNTSIDVQFPKVPAGGFIKTAQLIDYPTDTSQIGWIKAQLRAYGAWYAFDDDV